MAETLTVTGAYGRDYKSQKAVREDWKAGKDFKIIGGPYMSIRDVEQDPSIKVWVRYDGLKKIT